MSKPDSALKYDRALESVLSGIVNLLQGSYGISKRSVGLLLLQGDGEIEKLATEQEGDSYREIQKLVAVAKENYGQPLSYIIALQRQQAVKKLLDGTVTAGEEPRRGFAERLSRAMMHPFLGAVILLIVLYFGLYQFVGVFGAGTLVGFIENTVFGKWINPWITSIVTSLIPIQVLQDLFIGEYGIITLGFTYAFALILPIVGTFFIVFSIIEDSGYLPRLAMLIDRIFKKIGLSGRAVIPMVLGFGCDTMATIVTRTQETVRERVLTTLLLALAIPCSAQLGVIFAILSGNTESLLIWAGATVIIFLVVGFLAAKLIPGKPASFYMEVPPLRLPKISNIFVKTYSRLQWYFLEVFPVFILASFLLWLGDITGLLDTISRGLGPLMKLIGLPQETGFVFLYGFFRRDFGAAGLYDLHTSGIITGIPLLVSAVVLTLFVPCIAQFSVMLKERGWKTALAITAFIFPFAFFAGFLLNLILTRLGVSL